MPDEIRSQLPNDNYRKGWDAIWGKKEHDDEMSSAEHEAMVDDPEGVSGQY